MISPRSREAYRHFEFLQTMSETIHYRTAWMAWRDLKSVYQIVFMWSGLITSLKIINHLSVFNCHLYACPAVNLMKSMITSTGTVIWIIYIWGHGRAFTSLLLVLADWCVTPTVPHLSSLLFSTVLLGFISLFLSSFLVQLINLVKEINDSTSLAFMWTGLLMQSSDIEESHQP